MENQYTFYEVVSIITVIDNFKTMTYDFTKGIFKISVCPEQQALLMFYFPGIEKHFPESILLKNLLSLKIPNDIITSFFDIEDTAEKYMGKYSSKKLK